MPKVRAINIKIFKNIFMFYGYFIYIFTKFTML